MEHADIVVIGGGIAGLSAAAALAEHAEVVVLEQEAQPGYHASGRSVTLYHLGIGNLAVRALTVAGEGFFRAPPPGFVETPLVEPIPVLLVTHDGQDALSETVEGEMAKLGRPAERLSPQAVESRVPVLKVGPDHITRGLWSDGFRIDGAALLQAYGRMLRRSRGRVLTGRTVTAIARRADGWMVETDSGPIAAAVLVNAAGAWGDRVAALADVGPLGLAPLRRTVIGFDGPAGTDVSAWPFVRALGDEFYFLPDAGRLLASPADATPSDPCDAQPDEYDVALAAYRIEEATRMTVRRVLSRWAGLRTFSPDAVPVAGFQPGAPGFFWLVGQGGYGLQTSPAMSAAAASLILGRPWPETLDAVGIGPASLDPARFL